MKSYTASSAAAEGVGARRSATKSMIVVSVSCPTAEITGTEQSNTALATASSLNAQRSSMLPPPRPTIMTSTFSASSAWIPFTILSEAPSPCTSAGYRMICTKGFLRFVILMMSLTAAPVGAVTTPTAGYTLGSSACTPVQTFPFPAVLSSKVQSVHTEVLHRPARFFLHTTDIFHLLHRHPPHRVQ